MKHGALLLLTFCILAYQSPPLAAKDVGKHETVAKVTGYAIAGCDNAAVTLATILLTPLDAAALDVAILIKTATVEPQAKATVANGEWYKRLCAYHSNRLKNIRPVYFSKPLIHVDPGLRGC